MSPDPAELGFVEPRKRVGVIAAASGEQPATGATLDSGQQRILAALERAFPVSFVQGEATSLGRVDGLLVLGSASPTRHSAETPQLSLPLDGSPRQNDAGAAWRASGEAVSVVMRNDRALARPLRGRAIPERAAAGQLPQIPPTGRLLASVENDPVWWQLEEDAPLVFSAYPLATLDEGEALREHMRAGCFMRLLPLVHFITQVLGSDGWQAPPLRASFVIDDPNLHRPSYGFLNYRQLAAHATQNGYHVAVATVPIDAWLADRRTASLLASNAAAISLLVHGNDHVACELARLESDAAALAAIAQALRRIASFERRRGVSVDRVMAPPHGACSEPALRAMFRLDFDAACISRPYPWLDGRPAPTPLAGWQPAEMVAGGLPVLPRYPIGAPREDLALRAMLGQPLILYGHHGDLAQGLDILADAASEIDRLGEVRWGPLRSIASHSCTTRFCGELMLVRMFARRVALEVPAGVRALRVLVPEALGGAAGHRLTHGDEHTELVFADGVGASERLLETDAPTRIDLALPADRPLSPTAVPSPGVRPWPWIRRAMAEGRDRLQAIG